MTFAAKKFFALLQQPLKSFTLSGCSSQQHDSKGRVTKRHWQTVKKDQATTLAAIIDPSTSEPYLKFAYVPIPAELLKSAAQTSVDNIELTTIGDTGFESTTIGKSTLIDQSFASFEKEVNPTQSLDAPATAANSPADPSVAAERADLLKLSNDALKKQIKELGLEAPKNASKEELVDLILA